MFAEIGLLSMMLDQLRLEVEHVEMAGCPGHEELNNPVSYTHLTLPTILLV